MLALFGKICSNEVRAVDDDGGSEGGRLEVSNLRGRGGMGKGLMLCWGGSDVLRTVVRPDIEDEAVGTGLRRSSSEDRSMTIVSIFLAFELDAPREDGFDPEPFGSEELAWRRILARSAMSMGKGDSGTDGTGTPEFRVLSTLATREAEETLSMLSMLDKRPLYAGRGLGLCFGLS